MSGATAAIMSINSRAISLEGGSFIKISADPLDAYAGYRLVNDGHEQGGTGTTSVTYSDKNGWMIPPASGAASNYECRATLTAGTNPDIGTMGSWLSLGTTRTWENIQTVIGGPHTSTFTIEVRDASTTIVLATASVTLDVTVEP